MSGNRWKIGTNFVSPGDPDHAVLPLDTAPHRPSSSPPRPRGASRLPQYPIWRLGTACTIPTSRHIVVEQLTRPGTVPKCRASRVTGPLAIGPPLLNFLGITPVENHYEFDM